MNRLALERIVFDPLGIFGRARDYVAFAGAVRQALGNRLLGVYLDPVRRTVYLVLNSSKVVHGNVVKVADLREIENAARKASAEAFQGAPPRAVPTLRLGLSYPALSLVPVDEASAPPRPRSKSLRAAAGIAASLAALIGLSLPGSAKAEGPAVSAPNGKIEVEGGAISDSGAGGITGSFSLPVGHRYGFQMDGAVGIVEGDWFGGVGGHLFWRDPDRALLGVIAGHNEWDGWDMTRLGVESEFYLDQFSILARGGYQFGDYGVDEDGSGPYGKAELRWYATENFVLRGGVAQDDDKTRGLFGGEFQPGFAAAPGLSLFAEGDVGEDDYYTAFVGIRYYFGETKSLRDRHRKDDPTPEEVRWSNGWLHVFDKDKKAYGGELPPRD